MPVFLVVDFFFVFFAAVLLFAADLLLPLAAFAAVALLLLDAAFLALVFAGVLLAAAFLALVLAEALLVGAFTVLDFAFALAAVLLPLPDAAAFGGLTLTGLSDFSTRIVSGFSIVDGFQSRGAQRRNCLTGTLLTRRQFGHSAM